MIDAKELARSGCKYLGTSYKKMDCQAFWEQMLKDCGINKDLGGSNSWYRYIMQNGWCGTPEECKQKYGSIPKGATLFIREDVSASTPEKFRHDSIGDITHMGVYTAMTGNEMVQLALEEGNTKAPSYNFGDGAIHSSSTRGGVATSKFAGKTIPNGGWNRVGLWTEQINYFDSPEPPVPPTPPEPPTPPTPPDPPSPFPYDAVVTTDKVNTRKKPTSKSAQSKVGKLNTGDIVQVDDTIVNSSGEDWSKCEYTDERGAHWVNFWIKSCFLKPLESSEFEG